MQMNVLGTKQVSHVGSRDDHGQPIAGGDDQKCRRRVGRRSTGIQEPSCADIWTPGRRLWTEPGRQRQASIAGWITIHCAAASAQCKKTYYYRCFCSSGGGGGGDRCCCCYYCCYYYITFGFCLTGLFPGNHSR